VDEIKAMILLTFVIQPWPPNDFGILVDLQTFIEPKDCNGIQPEAFMLYTKALFGIDMTFNTNLTQPVSSELPCIMYMT
jgi:hypothetical protein